MFLGYSLRLIRFGACFLGQPARSAEKATSVHAFFLHLFWSAGEPMTKETLVCKSIELSWAQDSFSCNTAQS